MSVTRKCGKMTDLGVWRATIGRFHLACVFRLIRDRFRHSEKYTSGSDGIVTVVDVCTTWLCLLSFVWLCFSGKHVVVSAVDSPFFVMENYFAQETVLVNNTVSVTSCDIVLPTTPVSMTFPPFVPVLYLAVFALSSLRIRLSGDVEENPGPVDKIDNNADKNDKQRETNNNMEANLKQLEQSLQAKLDSILQAIGTQADTLRRQEEALKRQEDIMTKQGETLMQFGQEQETLKKTVNELFNDVKETKDGVKQNEQAIRKVSAKQTEIQDTVDRLEVELDRLETFSRRNNVKLFGIPEYGGMGREDCAETVRDILQTYLPSKSWAPDSIERAHRLGPPNPQNPNPRPIIVKFQRWADAMALMKDRHARDDMNNGGIRTAQDLTKRQAAKLRELRNDGKRGFYVNGKLRIRTDSPGSPERHAGDVTTNPPINSQEEVNNTTSQGHAAANADVRGDSVPGADGRPITRSTTRGQHYVSVKAWATTSARGGDRANNRK